MKEELKNYIKERIEYLKNEVYEATLEGNRFYAYRLESRIEELELIKNKLEL
jgi:hypothetical protein